MDRRRIILFPIALLGAATAASAQGTPRMTTTTPLPSVSVQEAHQRAKTGQSVLIDVRRPDEWADTGVPEGAIKLDMSSPAFVAKLATIRAENPGKPIDIICRTANRTRQLQAALVSQGWTNIINVRGGMLGNPTEIGWLAQGLPVVPHK